MAWAPNIPENIRKNGSGIAWASEVGSDEVGVDLGHFGPGIDLTQDVTTEEETDYRNPGRGKIMSDVTETDPQLALVLREQSEFNLQLSLMMGDFVDDNQAASYMDGVSSAYTAIYNYLDLGYRNAFSTKIIHGTESAPGFALNEPVTSTSGGTGKIKWHVTDSYVEIVNKGGTWAVGDTITGTTTSTSALITSVQELDDIIVCDAEPGTVRYVKGTDYNFFPEVGFWAITDSGLSSPVFISADYPAVDKKFAFGLATTTIEKKITLITNEADRGPTFKFTFWRMSLALNGAITVVGDGIGLINLTGKILADSDQATGEQYYKMEYI